MTYKILTIVGARPQFIKSAMLSKALQHYSDIQEIIVHTGQHYDENMSAIFFNEMRIPKPTYNLKVGSDTHGRQTGRILIELEAIFEREQPDLALVYGDTNSTLAGALCAVKRAVPVVHVEAGMRSYVQTQPEETNRVLTDHCSSLFLCSSETYAQNLAREGIHANVYNCGDLMHDSTLHFSTHPSTILSQMHLKTKQYVLLTCHRPETTDVEAHLRAVTQALEQSTLPVLFVAHPRTKKYLAQYNIQLNNVRVIDPVGYVDMLHLQRNAAAIVTDSGGMQKEAYFLNVPCITIREFTEWKELVATGWNTLVGYNQAALTHALHTVAQPKDKPALFGAGDAAPKMSARIHEYLVEK